MSEELQAQLDEMAGELLDRYEELTLLYDLGSSLASVFDVGRIAEIAVAKAAQAIGATRASVELVEDGALTIAARLGEAPPRAVAQQVAATARELLLHEGERRPAGEADDEGPVLSVPLLPPGDGPPLGALTVAGKPHAARFTAGDAKLAAAVAAQVATAVYTSRLVDSLRTAEALRREIEIAAGIQRALLPGRPPEVECAELAALCVPATHVGGDYYDFLIDERGRVSLVIADVAGHSIGSALMMAMARSILRRELAEGTRPDAVLAATNGVLFDDLVRAELFITVFCARFDPADRTLEYANGGHNPPLLRRARTGETVELDREGAALGIFREVDFERGAVELDAGDILLLYTDGVTEAAAASGEPFGETRLRAALDGRPPRELVEAVYGAVRAHTRSAGHMDDITLVALRARAAA